MTANRTAITPESYPFKEILEKRYNVILSNNPDYLFFSVFDKQHPYEYMKHNGIRIFYSRGENYSPDFTISDYAIGFDYISFDDRYLRFPQLIWTGFTLNELSEKHKNIDPSILNTKEYFCNFIYSNSECCPERKQIFDILNRYKKVTSAGTFLNNTGPDFIDKKVFSESKFDFMRKCKFTIACENYPFKGYLTEKLLHALGTNTIPIYFGDKTVANEINPKAFVNLHDYPTIESALNTIKEVDNNDELYLKMLHEPVFLNENYAQESVSRLETFLYNIFDQDYNIAFRRQRVMHALSHENCLREYNAMVANFWIKAVNKILRLY
jgi:hypothetical protein